MNIMYRIHYRTVLILSLLLGACTSQPQQTESLAQINCADFPGRWSGEKHWENGDVSTWVANHFTGTDATTNLSAHGRLSIDFESTRNGSPIRNHYNGSWSCNGNRIEAVTTDALGRNRTYRYQILELNDQKFRYQYLDEAGHGEIFEARRIGKAAD
jgi:heat shock protein HslJ